MTRQAESLPIAYHELHFVKLAAGGNTPQNAIDLAIEKLGKENVKILPKKGN